MKKLLPSILALAALASANAQTQSAWSDAETWAFLPGEDTYTDKALFDLRPLLEKTAGEKGWIKHDAKGDFTLGDGTPVRFWATNGGMYDGDQAKMEAFARHAAKRGVNLVRLFNGQPADSPDNPVPDAKKIAEFQMAVATLKKHGIYSNISIYWKSDGLLFWQPTRQAAYKNWWRELLTTPNPFCPDKTPLKDDPAIAYLQIQNEDSWLFWTMQGIHDEKRREEHDTLNAQFKEWQQANNLPEADLNFRFWNMDDGDTTRSRVPPLAHRLTMRFAAEKMRSFNAAIAKFLREEIGCPALVNAGNWHTADQVRLLDHERWSYDANEVIAKNQYVDITGHHNPNGRAGWMVEAGDTFQNFSCVRGDNWRLLPTNAKQIKGKPFTVMETGWVSPNLFQAEAPFLLSAYMSLTGVDACFWYVIGSPGYDTHSWPWHSGLYKWSNHSSPQVLGGFPATAWMFHKGYIKRGQISVDEKRAFDGDLWELSVPVITEDTHFDPNRPGTARSKSNIIGGAPFAAFMIGPVEIEYGKDPAGTTVNLHGNAPDDLAKGVIKSSTGEVLMDTTRGICVINAPCAQGVAGFLAEAETVTTDVFTFDIFNDYGAALAVSLDGLPLATSKKILLQITTQSRPDGWADELTTRDGKEVIRIKNTGGGTHNAGKNHWLVKNASGIVAIKNAGLTKATLCDANFYAAADIPVKRRAGSLELKLPANALYIVLE